MFEWKIGPSAFLNWLRVNVSDVSNDCKTAHSIFAGLTGTGLVINIM